MLTTTTTTTTTTAAATTTTTTAAAAAATTTTTNHNTTTHNNNNHHDSNNARPPSSLPARRSSWTRSTPCRGLSAPWSTSSTLLLSLLSLLSLVLLLLLLIFNYNIKTRKSCSQQYIDRRHLLARRDARLRLRAAYRSRTTDGWRWCITSRHKSSI